MPLHKSVIHPLACNEKKQTIPTELKAGLLDFFAQAGQTAKHYKELLTVVGGDGMTYGQLLELQHILQFSDNAFKSMEIIEPLLQMWHTKWTNLSHLFKTHWGCTTGKSTNPASLGHSAQKIGRATPSNLTKVDFYSGAEILGTVLDARLLDCWSCVTLVFSSA